ncbi:Uncharacterised protein [uncultured Clostridium sp.]|uniref:DUF7210 family protein n=1 Tax=uncultured Clostridium sp. TaxID=59620 RepID=UPI000821EABC|nr:hypothetical protein [uncultured Clostridium sp.]SCJ52183.1 Uncharacterised protein [uncultured Clostridium sp.]
MAKAKTYKVKALINIKYDKTVAKIGEELKVKKNDLEELIKNGYVEALEEIKDDDNPKDGEGSNENDEAGEKEGEE